jgi:hypothetical protein
VRKRKTVICCLIFLSIALRGCGAVGVVSPTLSEPRQSRTDPNLGSSLAGEQDATFEIGISLEASPSTPTAYDRTSVALNTALLPLELVEMVDETRGIQAKGVGLHTRLDRLFGSKSGLTDNITIRAVVRVRGQPGEKILRKTVWFRTVPPEIMTKAEARGSIGVVVELDPPRNPEASLSQNVMLVQRQTISQAQDELLAALEGTEYKLIRRFDVIPGCALEASPRALAVLDRLPNVIKVSEDMSHIIRIP